MKKLSIETVQNKIKETLIYKKYLNYIEALIERTSFNKKVLMLRDKYHIPPKGHRVKGKGKFKEKQLIEIFNKLDRTSLYKEADILVAEYELPNMWEPLILHYIVFNDLDYKLPYTLTLEIADIRFCTIGPHKDAEEKEVALGYLESMSKTHPLAILITPYASQKEIIDYIKKLDKSIKELQKKYQKHQSRLGKERSKNQKIKARDNFIIENRRMPIKELTSLVNTEFQMNMDYSYTQRIIREWKRSEFG